MKCSHYLTMFIVLLYLSNTYVHSTHVKNKEVVMGMNEEDYDNVLNTIIKNNGNRNSKKYR